MYLWADIKVVVRHLFSWKQEKITKETFIFLRLENVNCQLIKQLLPRNKESEKLSLCNLISQQKDC
jgi:hypothetical protein